MEVVKFNTQLIANKTAAIALMVERRGTDWIVADFQFDESNWSCFVRVLAQQNLTHTFHWEQLVYTRCGGPA